MTVTHDGYISWLKALERKKAPDLGAGVGWGVGSEKRSSDLAVPAVPKGGGRA